MLISTDEARSDVILAAATTLFGGAVISLLANIPGYPTSGMAAGLLQAVWAFVITGLVPLLLARHRGDGADAFGLRGPRRAWRRGLLLAVPVVVLETLRWLTVSDSLLTALLGRLGPATAGPALVPTSSLARASVVVGAVQLVAITAGAILLVAFLVTRGRVGFRPDPQPMTRLLRTFGLGAAGVALVLGLIRAIGDVRVVPVVLSALGLAALVLVADRLIPAGTTVPRGAVLAPAVVVLIGHVFAAGGVLTGNILVGLHTGALAVGATLVCALLLSTRWLAWAAVPLLVALHWWPSCLSPLALEVGIAGC